jgi:hypothetical protein
MRLYLHVDLESAKRGPGHATNTLKMSTDGNQTSRDRELHTTVPSGIVALRRTTSTPSLMTIPFGSPVFSDPCCSPLRFTSRQLLPMRVFLSMIALRIVVLAPMPGVGMGLSASWGEERVVGVMTARGGGGVGVDGGLHEAPPAYYKQAPPQAKMTRGKLLTQRDHPLCQLLLPVPLGLVLVRPKYDRVLRCCLYRGCDASGCVCQGGCR